MGKRVRTALKTFFNPCEASLFHPSPAIKSFVIPQRVNRCRARGVSKGFPDVRGGFPWVSSGFPEGFLRVSLGFLRFPEGFLTRS